MVAKNFSYDDVLQSVSVSRETYQRLQTYVALLEKWQKSINLIGNTTLQEIWSRHIIDSGQLLTYMDDSQTIMDVGSGAGFPGLILSLMGKSDVTLVESDARKIAFLNEANRITDAGATIIHARIEVVDISDYSMIVARAFAPLPALFGMIEKTLKTSSKLLLLKGKHYIDEIIEARKAWTFNYEAFPSVTHPEGVVLLINNFTRASIL